MNDPRAFLLDLFQTAVGAVSADLCLPAHLPPPPAGRAVVIGAGKAAAAMAATLERHWAGDPARLSGLVVTRYGHGQPTSRIEVVEAAHPVPDEAGQRAAGRMLELVRGLTADDLVICLLSGGGSALLAWPAEGITLEDKRMLARALLRSGASIGEINCVRKHLSAIKGGRLALACQPARVHTLIVSDVPGDDPAVVASGPTLADPTTCADALAVLEKYGIEAPPAVSAFLRAGRGETPKPGDPRLAGHACAIVADAQHALEAAAHAARAQGVEAHILSDAIEGEARDVALVHAALARQVARRGQPFARPCVILSGGETTVTVRGQGRGGRNAEFLLALGLALEGVHGAWALAADTDGIDGVESNAGALLTPDTLARAAAAGVDARARLADNDAFGFFEALGDLVISGPTRTNVNDFRALYLP